LDELQSWLTQQHSGLRTYKDFQQKAYALIAKDRDHAALYYLLASLVGRFVDAYDEEPLPVGVADKAFDQLLDLVKRGAQSLKASPADQLKLLNDIAAAELG
jgi:hypothetical protein